MGWKDKISQAMGTAVKNTQTAGTNGISGGIVSNGTARRGTTGGITKAFNAYTKKNPQSAYLYKSGNANGIAKSEPSTSYVNSDIPEGGIGIRKALNGYGIKNSDIGYREDNGNGIVTVGGKDFMTADAVKDGISYGTQGAIRKAFGAYQASNGDPIVKVSDYVTGKGLGANLSYNDTTGTVSVGGNEFKPSYIDNGISYAPKSTVDKAIADYQNNTGLLNYADLIKKNNEEYGKYTKKLIDALTERGKFDYNPESDPAYIAYKNMYEREGQRAAEEAVASYAGLNGGLGTSAAVTAAAQAQNAWLDKLNDRIPELYDGAYKRYTDERNFDIDALSQIEGLKQQALNNEMQAQGAMYDAVTGENERNRQRYLDALSQKQTEEDREYARRANDLSLAEGNLNLDNAKVQSILNNATIRGYFTEDEANALGVDINTNPMATATRLDLYTYDKQKGIDADYDVDTYGRKLDLESQYAPVVASSGKGSGGSRGSRGSGSSKSSGTSSKKVKSIVNNFNSQYKEDFGGNAILYDGDGGYYLNPDLSDSEKETVKRNIAGWVSGMSGDQTDAAMVLFDELGIDDNTITTQYMMKNEPQKYADELKKDLFKRTGIGGGIKIGY